MTGSSEQFTFQNKAGETLSGSLELPDQPAKATALFAHCFSCNKNVLAASRVSRALRDQGFAVLRFDFTGLGQSEGDFSNTNFSTNLDDLRSAVEALRERKMSPQILVGHSLGGAAVLYLAGEIDEVALVATIGAPSEPSHLSHLFSDETLQTIEATGRAEMSLGGKPFTITKEFLADIQETSLKKKLSSLKKPVLICHSPTDSVVGIDQARKIYESANHPKSFVSLDGADHLLRSKSDAKFVGQLISTWAARYLDLEDESSQQEPNPPSGQTSADQIPAGHVLVRSRGDSLTQDVFAGKHLMVADEPTAVGGNDLGVTPYDLLLAALGTCTSMTLRMYAQRKQISLSGIEITLDHSRVHADDCATCDDQAARVDQITRLIRIDGDLTPEQRSRMMEIADLCPVHRTLFNQKQVVTKPVLPETET